MAIIWLLVSVRSSVSCAREPVAPVPSAITAVGLA